MSFLNPGLVAVLAPLLLLPRKSLRRSAVWRGSRHMTMSLCGSEDVPSSVAIASSMFAAVKLTVVVPAVPLRLSKSPTPSISAVS